MSAPDSRTENKSEASEEQEFFTYQGSKVPFFIVLLWVVFFVWGSIYLVRWIPESWMEWFSR